MTAVTAEGIRNLLQANIDRRLTDLPGELGDWKAVVAANTNGAGIHFSQINALSQMMAGLHDRQVQQRDGLAAKPDLATFSDSYYALLTDLGGANDLWRIFRIILDQRQDPHLRVLADTCDLIAADTYLASLNHAFKWGTLPREQFRPPPLTFLESCLTPATASRGETIESLGFSVRQYRDLMLPLPVVLYPIDQAGSIWSMCAIVHEVGHNLDHDLEPQVGRRLTDQYRKLLIGRVDDMREPQWRRWMNEIFADAVAVALCGYGFVVSMAGWVLGLAPGAAFQAFDRTAVHPPLMLRLRVLGHMLSLTGTARSAEGARIVALCDQLARPAWEAAYEPEAKTIAGLLLSEPVKSLAGHTLLELNDDLGTDEDRILQLSLHFLDSKQQRPDPKQDPPIPFRTVCAAASLAATGLPGPTSANLDGLQKTALDYFQAIPRPKKLAAPDKDSQDFLDQLTARLSFRAPNQARKESGS